MKHLLTLNRYFYRYKWLLILGFFFVITSNIFSILPPQIIRYAFDLVKDNITYHGLYEGFRLQDDLYDVFSHSIMFFGLTVLTLAIIKGILMFFMRQTIIVMSRHIEYDLRNDIYAHYQSLDTAFYKRNRTGDLMSRVTEDVNRVRMYLGPAIMYSINLTTMIIITLVVMLQVNIELTLYVLLPLPLLAISIYFVNTLTNQRSEAIQRQLSKLTSTAQEAFSGIRVIKAYSQETAIISHFTEESHTYKTRTLSMARIQAFFAPLMVLLIGLSTILTIYIGGKQVIMGNITAGNIAEFVIYVGMLMWPVTSIGWTASLIQRAAASQKRINEFLHIKPAITNTPNAAGLDLDGNLTFENVSFTYPDTGIQALKNISFSLKAGERLAIVGRTGAGKSTLAELLCRKYEPNQGQILFNEAQIPIKQIDLTSLRRQMGYVPQDVFLFSDSIAGNIAFGNPNCTQADIEEAARGAAVYDDIMQLPHQFETIVGERGVTLSGGQKQRASLARALIKKPQMIVLDDCLSAVDARTERHILEYLDQYLNNRTAIVITHRIFSLMAFDKIIVLENGRIVEQGKHHELLAADGIYAKLYEKQNAEAGAVLDNEVLT